MSKAKVFSVEIDGTKTDITFRRPTHADVLAMDLEYRRMFGVAVRGGLMTKSEAEKHYESSGAWNSDDEEKTGLKVARVGVLNHIIENKDGEYDQKEIDKALSEIDGARASAYEAIARKTELFNQTAEGFADEQKMHKFVELCCTKAKEGEDLFADRDAYNKFLHENAGALSEIFKQAYFFEYGLPDDISDNWAEVKYRRKKLAEQKKADKQPKTKKAKKTTKKKVAKK